MTGFSSGESARLSVGQDGRSYYIASCVFTSQFPGLSWRMQEYVSERFNMPVVRCCVPNYRLQDFLEKMPENYREKWGKLPDSGGFKPGDTVYTLCHDCSAIIEEAYPGVKHVSLWELILSDESFRFPNHRQREIFVQDCWRVRDNAFEQAAARALLEKMNLKVREAAENHEKTEFCGISLYRAAPKRNLAMAPWRYVENAAGKFNEKSESGQTELMREHCAQFGESSVAAYCHYCLEGLRLGGAQAFHLAQLLFEPEECFEHQSVGD